MTNKEKYFPGVQLDIDTLAFRSTCPERIDNTFHGCCCADCYECKKSWLNSESAEPKKEPQKPNVPAQIDRPNFERQLESYSMKAFVQQFKYLACKINEILMYLEERDGKTD